MVAQQRHALFRVLVTSAALILFLGLIPRVGVWRAQSAFGVLGFLGAAPLVIGKSRARLLFDERDRQIHLKAIQIGTGIFWVLFAAGMWAAYWHFHNDRVVPVTGIALLAWLTWTAFELCNAGAMLFLYRRS